MTYLDLLHEAVGWISADGVLRPENRAMREFCSGIPSDPDGQIRFLRLPMEDEDRSALREFLATESGQHEFVITLTGGGSPLHLCVLLAAEGDGHWVVVRDETEVRHEKAENLRLARMRLLGSLADGVLHDVNNLLGGIVGLADHLAESATDSDQTAFLRRVISGTKQRGAILRGLHQAIHCHRSGRRRVVLASLVDDTLELLRKTAMHSGIELALDIADDLLEVRVVPEDVMHALLALLSRAMQSGCKDIRVEVRRGLVGGLTADLPSRSYGVIGILDDADDPGLRHLLTAPEHGLSADGGPLDDTLHDLLMALLSIQAFGGFLRLGDGQQCEPGDPRCKSLFLPAAGRRESSG